MQKWKFWSLKKNNPFEIRNVIFSVWNERVTTNMHMNRLKLTIANSIDYSAQFHFGCSPNRAGNKFQNKDLD